MINLITILLTTFLSFSTFATTVSEEASYPQTAQDIQNAESKNSTHQQHECMHSQYKNHIKKKESLFDEREKLLAKRKMAEKYNKSVDRYQDDKNIFWDNRVDYFYEPSIKRKNETFLIEVTIDELEVLLDYKKSKHKQNPLGIDDKNMKLHNKN